MEYVQNSVPHYEMRKLRVSRFVYANKLLFTDSNIQLGYSI